MSDEQLAPVFIPPLASLLAAAEAERGRPLTREEAEELRDRAVCMMMKVGEATALQTARGYRDVEPEDLWADWHRLRVDLTGDGYQPKLVWCLVGGEDFTEVATPLLEKERLEYEWAARDPRMLTSFLASQSRLQPTLTDAEKRSIDAHQQILYLLSPNFRADQAVATSARYLSLVARLLEEGAATAAKCESSGLAHGKSRWLDLDKAGSLVEAYVQLPIADDRDLWSCGMHLLGRTDLILSREIFPDDDWEAARYLHIFSRYLIEECPHFPSGHTFSCDAESAPLRAVWEPCDRYEEDEFFHNPYGRLRLQPA